MTETQELSPASNIRETWEGKSTATAAAAAVNDAPA